jgi:hypothetical protein
MNSLKLAKFLHYNWEFIIIRAVYVGVKQGFGTENVVRFNGEFVITEFVITKFVITEFVITKFVITKFVITEFDCITKNIFSDFFFQFLSFALWLKIYMIFSYDLHYLFSNVKMYNFQSRSYKDSPFYIIKFDAIP